MIYSIFSHDAEPKMLSVCSELFKLDVFSSYCDFDLLRDGDNNMSGSVIGFCIKSSCSLTMDDFICMNNVCDEYCCYYAVRPCNDFDSLLVSFYFR